MKNVSTKLSAFALLAAFAVATPAFADDTPAGVASDANAVQKDNSALSQDNADLARHRAAKAADKANDKWGSQAIDSVNIGVDKAKRGEKDTERNTDKKSLRNDANDAAGTDAQGNKAPQSE